MMICFLLEIFAWYGWKLTDSYALLVLTFASMLMIAVTFQGTLGCYRAVKDLNVENLAVVSVANAGQQVLLRTFYFIIPFFAVYCVFGTDALFFPQEVLAYHRAMTMGLETYGGISVASHLEFVEVYITTGGYTTYLICAIVLITYYYFFYLSTEYEACHVLL
jgi:hypothetical protein